MLKHHDQKQLMKERVNSWADDSKGIRASHGGEAWPWKEQEAGHPHPQVHRRSRDSELEIEWGMDAQRMSHP